MHEPLVSGVFTIMHPVTGAARRLFGAYSGLPAPVYALFTANIINAVGIFVFPFLTLYLTARLKLSTPEAGRILLYTSIAYTLGSMLGGKLADKRGRKGVSVIAQIVSALLYIPCGFPAFGNAVPALVVASVFFDGLCDPARSAMMTDLTQPETRRAAFSLTYLGHNIGFAGGSLIAGFLFESASGWIFWGNAIASTAAALLIWFAVPETKPSEHQVEASYAATGEERGHRGSLLQALASRPGLLVFAVLTSLYGFTYAQHRFALPLQMKASFGLSGSAIYGSLMTLNGVLVILLSTPIMNLTRRWRPVNAVAFSGILFGIGFAAVAIPGGLAMVYLSTFVWTLGEIFNATNEGTYMADHTPLTHRARFQAVLPFIQGLGFTLSPPVAGTVIGTWGLGMVWPLAGIASLVACAGLYALGLAENGYFRSKSTRIRIEGKSGAGE